MPTKFSLRDRPLVNGVLSNAIFQALWYGIAAVIGLIARNWASIRGVAPHWAIVIGALVFFLLALTYNLLFVRRRASAEVEANDAYESYVTAPREVVTVQTNRICPYEWSHQIIENQRTGINHFVQVTGCSMQVPQLSKVVPFILFVFTIRNISIFTLTVEDALEGIVEFTIDKHVFAGPVRMVDNTMKRCLYGNSGRLQIELRLSREEADLLVQSMNASSQPGATLPAFIFDRLFVTIRGDEADKAVIPQKKGLERIVFLIGGTSEEYYR